MDQSPKVLVVEDQFFIAADTEMILKSAGFDCVGLATDADEALKLARECQPDIILMDIRLASRTDGVQAATHIYQELGIRSIFASGHADNQLREEARAACPLGWLNKPYTSTDLVNAVNQGLAEIRPGAPHSESVSIH